VQSITFTTSTTIRYRPTSPSPSRPYVLEQTTNDLLELWKKVNSPRKEGSQCTRQSEHIQKKRMLETTKALAIGGLTVLIIIASTVLNVVFASNVADNLIISGLRVTLYVAFGLNLLSLVSLCFFSTIYVRNLAGHSIGQKKSTWAQYVMGVSIAAIALAVSGGSLVWLVVRRLDLPRAMLRQSPIVLVAVWFTLWGVSLILQAALFAYLGSWTWNALRTRSAGRLDLDFGIRVPSMAEARPTTRESRRSFQSQDPTLHSPPRTPISRRRRSSHARRSSSTRVGPGSGPNSASRTKLVGKGSARSSFEIPPFPASEAFSIDSAFDQYDTSSVHRAALHSSPPVARPGLETIPGSRPDSLADALDGPFLPDSPHATTTDTATVLGYNSSSSPRAPNSSPPSSPPNFSRPTSSGYNKTPPRNYDAPPPPPPNFGAPLHELIHPLFRPNSPHPAPIAISGTMVTASPLSDQVITPRMLARLRSNSNLQGHWRAIPSVSEKPSTVGSRAGSPGMGSDGTGSPGPSIVEEEDLPPILPGFVLSAGQRSSFLGFAKRKSVKNRRNSSQLYDGDGD